MKGIRTAAVLAAGLAVLLPVTAMPQDARALSELCAERVAAAVETNEAALSEETRSLCEEEFGDELDYGKLLLLLSERLLEGGEDQRAADVLRLAAGLGNSNAKVLLGRLYTNGRGVPLDNMEAHHWLQVPAENGNAEAQLLFGALFLGRNASPRTRTKPSAG